MTSQPKVYIASKLDHADKWIALWQRWPEVHLTMRWPFMVGRLGEEPNAARFWQDDLADVARADFVLVYGEPQEHLRGALVEAGMGIALEKKIIVVGEHPDYGSWQYHPSVTKVGDLQTAYYYLVHGHVSPAAGPNAFPAFNITPKS